jgi:hypothetical protein
MSLFHDSLNRPLETIAIAQRYAQESSRASFLYYEAGYYLSACWQQDANSQRAAWLREAMGLIEQDQEYA